MLRKDYGTFEEVLLRHCSTLESLHFNISLEERATEEYVSVPIPAFSNLCNLHIEWGPCTQVKLTFPGGRINYREDFPGLKYLILCPTELWKRQLYNRTLVSRLKKDSFRALDESRKTWRPWEACKSWISWRESGWRVGVMRHCLVRGWLSG